MFRTALRNVLAHKARLLMTTLAVLLGVAFVAGTLIFTSTVSEAFRKGYEQGMGHVDVAIQPEDTGTGEGWSRPPDLLSASVLDDVGALPEVSKATGSVSGPVSLADRNGDVVGNGWASQGRNYPGEEDERYTLIEGRAPEHGGEIMLDSATRDRTGYQVGDTVRMSVNGPLMEPRISGIFDTTDGAVAAGGVLVLFDEKSAAGHFATPTGEFDLISVSAAEGVSQQQLQQVIAPLLPSGATADTGAQLIADEAALIEESMSGMRLSLLVFAGIALFVGIFIIANTFTMLIAQRTKELALLRAIGASRRQVTRSVLIEAGLVGLVAGGAGLLLGCGIALGMGPLMSSLGSTFPDGPLQVSGTAVGASLLVGVGVTLFSAYLPARRASRIPPVAALNSTHAPSGNRSLLVRNTIGALFSAAGLALVLTGVVTGEGATSVGLLMGLGGALLVLGVFVLTPLLSRPVVGLCSPLLRGFGVAGRLARLNALRNPRRTAATASALMVGLTLITGLTVIAGGVQKGIDKLAADSLSADFTVSMAHYAPLAPEIKETLEAHPSVTGVSGLTPGRVAVDDGTVTATGVNTETIQDLVVLDVQAGSVAELGRNTAMVDESFAAEHALAVGDRFSLTWEDDRSGELAVAGVYEANLLMSGLVIDGDLLDSHQSQSGDMELLLSTTDGSSEAMRGELAAALGDNPAIKLLDGEGISEEVSSTLTLMLNLLYGLLAMAVIVAVIGVINTLAMSVFERRQEIGMLRAVGLDRPGTRLMVRMESVMIALYGGLLGVGLGVFFGWAVGEVIAVSLPTVELVIPWQQLGLFLGLAGLVGILAAWWPARRAAGLNMLDAIKAD